MGKKSEHGVPCRKCGLGVCWEEDETSYGGSKVLHLDRSESYTGAALVRISTIIQLRFLKFTVNFKTYKGKKYSKICSVVSRGEVY